MKTIELSDKDYKDLMELSKEYQTQENDCQAFPYLWEPSSLHLVPDVNGEGEITKMYKDSEEYTPQEFAELNESDFDSFISEQAEIDESCSDIKCDDKRFNEVEKDWIIYVELNDLADCIRTFNKEDESEHNPSFFKSDVQEFIKNNWYHLGEKPHTYARTAWRMDRMEKLVSILCRINPQENATTEIKASALKEN
jgi:hypothetical protein